MAYARYAQGRGRIRRPNQKSEAQSHDATTNRGPWFTFPSPISIFYLLSLFFFALGLMSKPMLVTWPFVMLLLDYWPLRRFESSVLNYSTLNHRAPGAGEDPVFCPRGVDERRDLRRAEARRRFGGG